ncbi:MAG: hypothetical protein Q7S11_02905 [bacterium]|nr:hypothetical protein [bacterium]
MRWIKILFTLLLVLIGIYFYLFDPVGIETAKFYFELTAISILIVILGVLAFFVIALFSSRVWGKLKNTTTKTSEVESTKGMDTKKVTPIPRSSLADGSFYWVKFVILCAWLVFLVAIWSFDSTLWKQVATDHWKWFIFWNAVAISVLVIASAKVSFVTFMMLGALLLFEAGPQKPKYVAQAVARGESSVVLVAHEFTPSQEFRFPLNLIKTDFDCAENVILRVKFKVRGIPYTNTVPCGPEIQSSIIDIEKYPELKGVTVVSDYRVQVEPPKQKGRKVSVKVIMKHHS